jgi:hypothetical protein
LFLLRFRLKQQTQVVTDIKMALFRSVNRTVALLPTSIPSIKGVILAQILNSPVLEAEIIQW